MDEVLEFWFEKPATTTEEYGRKIRRWYMGGAALDEQIRERFTSLVESALAGALNDWPQTPRGRVGLILLLDQFTRSIYRDDPRSYAGDERAQALAVEAFDRGIDRELSIEERLFLTMPFLHSEDLALQERGVVAMEAIVADAAEFQKPMLAMGTEQSRKYRDLIAQFGRFPHRNVLLGRTSTPEEEAFLLDWEQRRAPAGTGTLPT